MPITDYQFHDLGVCECCDTKTSQSSGTVTLQDQREALYFASWTAGHPENGIFFLVSHPIQEGFITVRYYDQSNSFMVCDPDEKTSEVVKSLRLFLRSEIIGTPTAGILFQFIDEIWLCDPNLPNGLTKAKGLARFKSLAKTVIQRLTRRTS